MERDACILLIYMPRHRRAFRGTSHAHISFDIAIWERFQIMPVYNAR